jgi:hypothetical protein
VRKLTQYFTALLVRTVVVIQPAFAKYSFPRIEGTGKALTGLAGLSQDWGEAKNFAIPQSSIGAKEQHLAPVSGEVAAVTSVTSGG